MLDTVRLCGSVSFTAEFSAPWALESPNHELLADVVVRVLLGADGWAVRSLDDLHVALQAALNRPALLLVARGDAFIVLTFPAV